MWRQSETYPDPSVEVLDPRFLKYRITNAAVERLATGMRFGEGPVWFGDGRFLLWSDIPNNRIMRWDEESGAVSVFRKPSGFANGNTRDRQGRLITCEHGNRRVTRTEYNGTVTVLMDRFAGKRLNSPNDVVVKSDDSIWLPIRPLAFSATTVASKRKRNCRPTCTALIRAPVKQRSSLATSPIPMACASRRMSVAFTLWSPDRSHAASGYMTWRMADVSSTAASLSTVANTVRRMAFAATWTVTCGRAGAQGRS